MNKKKVRCEKCRCWEPVGQTGRGNCTRRSPETSEQALAYWPQPMYNEGCWDGVPISTELLND